MAELAGVPVALVLATSTGGVGRHVRSLAAGLPAHGATVTVCGPAATEELFAFTRTGASFVPVEIGPGRRPVADGRALGRLVVGLRGAAVVHAHGLRAGLLAGLALRPRTPYVVTWHNAVLTGGLRRRLAAMPEAVVARRAGVTLAVSGDLVDRARDLGARDVRLLPVPAPALPAPAPSTSIRQELDALDRPLVLAVGRLHRQKGYPTLLEAVARWAGRRPRPVVAIAGDGPDRDDLASEIAARGIDVRLLGHRDDVPSLLAAADVVVLPSRWEGSPLAAQEALSAGRPLVATAVGGVPDLVGDGALLVSPGDPAGLADAVSRLLDDPVAAAALASRGRERAASWPGEAASVAAIAGIYLELLGRRP